RRCFTRHLLCAARRTQSAPRSTTQVHRPLHTAKFKIAIVASYAIAPRELAARDRPSRRPLVMRPVAVEDAFDSSAVSLSKSLVWSSRPDSAPRRAERRLQRFDVGPPPTSAPPVTRRSDRPPPRALATQSPCSCPHNSGRARRFYEELVDCCRSGGVF